MRIAVLLLLAGSVCWAAEARTISVQGSASGSVPVDTVGWEFSIYTSADSIAAASAAADAARDRMQARLAALKIPPGALVSEGMSQGTVWIFAGSRRRPDGYYTQRSFRLTLHDLRLYPAVSEKLFVDSAIEVQRVSTSSTRQRDAERAQLVRALVDAKANAELIAGQLGLRLGAVRSVSCFPPEPEIPERVELGGFAVRSQAAPLEPVAVQATVTVVYDIAP
jgi:uncharacterized protein YggE